MYSYRIRYLVQYRYIHPYMVLHGGKGTLKMFLYFLPVHNALDVGLDVGGTYGTFVYPGGAYEYGRSTPDRDLRTHHFLVPNCVLTTIARQWKYINL